MSTNSFITNDGVKIVYEKHGEGEIPLILIHGWSGSRRYFDFNVSAFTSIATVYRLDLRFHGDSDKPAWGHLVCRLAADVHDMIQQLQLKKVTLLGCSMGSSIIWAYCTLYGYENLLGAVFVDQSPLQNQKPDWNLGSKSCYDEATLQSTIEDLKNMNPFSDSIIQSCISLPVSPDFVKILKEETLKADGDALGKLMADHTHIDWRPILPRIGIPTMNWIGLRSGVFPREGIALERPSLSASSKGVLKVSELIPNCITIERDANHWLYIEESEVFNSKVIEFLKDISPK